MFEKGVEDSSAVWDEATIKVYQSQELTTLAC